MVLLKLLWLLAERTTMSVLEVHGHGTADVMAMMPAVVVIVTIDEVMMPAAVDIDAEMEKCVGLLDSVNQLMSTGTVADATGTSAKQTVELSAEMTAETTLEMTAEVTMSAAVVVEGKMAAVVLSGVVQIKVIEIGMVAASGVERMVEAEVKGMSNKYLEVKEGVRKTSGVAESRVCRMAAAEALAEHRFRLHVSPKGRDGHHCTARAVRRVWAVCVSKS